MLSGRAPCAGVVLLVALSSAACADALSYGVRGRYHTAAPQPEPARTVTLLSAHATGYAPGDPLEGSSIEVSVLLVFSAEIDPLTVAPEAFAVVRADGRRVRPTRARLGPADEGDENRSVQLFGAFGQVGAEPIAVHVLGPLFSEGGEPLEGLDAAIAPLDQPDRLLALEPLSPDPQRCPDARAVLRTYWSDALAGVGASDLAAIELRGGDGQVRAPTGFDDQARLDDDTAALPGPPDDNVLDLCLDFDDPVVYLRVAAGIFSDPLGHPTAAGEVALAPG